MSKQKGFTAVALHCAALVLCLAVTGPALAQEARTAQTFRYQYDSMMSGFERVFAVQGNTAGLERVRAGRDAMKALTDDQLRVAFVNGYPDLTAGVKASEFLAAKAEFQKDSGESSKDLGKTPGFPEADPIVSNCDGVDITPSTRYALFIIKEVANSILAAAAWVCNEDILGENGSLACVPLAIAADIANGFFDTATFCAGEVTANQVDGNYRRLDHIHGDLEASVANDNTNTTSIENNDNANTTNILASLAASTTTIVNNDNSNTAAIETNDNTNTAAIETNDNNNTTTILTNANANKNELRDLILRTQIEADMAMTDSAAVVALYEIPTANGGYLDLVQFIVTDTINKVLAAGGTVGTAQQMLTDANTAKAAGLFKAAYATYRKAYKAAGK